MLRFHALFAAAAPGVPRITMPPGPAQPRVVPLRSNGSTDGRGGRAADDTRVCSGEDDVVPVIPGHSTWSAASRRAVRACAVVCVTSYCTSCTVSTAVDTWMCGGEDDAVPVIPGTYRLVCRWQASCKGLVLLCTSFGCRMLHARHGS
jgi:hypothetical protein